MAAQPPRREGEMRFAPAAIPRRIWRMDAHPIFPVALERWLHSRG